MTPSYLTFIKLLLICLCVALMELLEYYITHKVMWYPLLSLTERYREKCFQTSIVCMDIVVFLSDMFPLSLTNDFWDNGIIKTFWSSYINKIAYVLSGPNDWPELLQFFCEVWSCLTDYVCKIFINTLHFVPWKYSIYILYKYKNTALSTEQIIP